jgi:RNA polymerase sporulation-specific sigma factor
MNFPKSELSKQDALHLWITCRSEYAKEQMFLTNYGIVFFVMQRLGIPAFDEDMFQIGSIGLLKAIDTFDASKGCFSTYAFRLVRNELLMAFRKSKRSVMAAFSLDDNADIGSGESVPYAEMIADGKDYEENAVNFMLAQQIFEMLGSREKHIFTMFFVENRTQSEISKALGISQPHVSRIISSMKKSGKEGKQNEGN